MSKFKHLGTGSAKNLWLDPESPKHIRMEFTDRISVFDYGALPDSIPGRNLSLMRLAKYFFEDLATIGVKTAYQGVDGDSVLLLERARHPKFPSDGDEALDLEFLPLEVIFRFGVPEGSSLLKRRLDLKAGHRFDQVLVEFSTKLESQDRMLDEKEARSFLPHSALFEQLQVQTKKIAQRLKLLANNCGLELWDGKFEFAYNSKNEIVLIDAITPDELRLTLKGASSVPLSKELLRHWLGATTWAAQLRYSKMDHLEDWKHRIPSPPRLGKWRIEKLSALYHSLADAFEQSKSAPILNWMRQDVLRPKVCVIGGGGREAALRWRLQQENCEIVETPRDADSVWVSMDGDLEQGLVDQLQSQGFWTMGPQRLAARTEWSKEFGRCLAQKAQIPIPRFESDCLQLSSFESLPVVKLDGLAAGKGVVVPESMEEAQRAIEDFSKRGKVLLEERLRGFEASTFFSIETGAQGVRVAFLGTAKDFKRRLPNDEGPNTGGMGAYAPHPDLDEEDIALFTSWARQTAQVLDEERTPFHGILYLGLMKDEKKGWNLIEYNARFGDPETQALMVGWSEGFYLRSLLQLDLQSRALNVEFREPTLCLALVRSEYPEAPSEENFVLPEWTAPESVKLFRAKGVTGRVAYLVASAPSLMEAGDSIFSALVESPWRSMLEWRPDILR